MYEYIETEKHKTPNGEGWEYWGDRIVKDENGETIEHVAVWRRPEKQIEY